MAKKHTILDHPMIVLLTGKGKVWQYYEMMRII